MCTPSTKPDLASFVISQTCLRILECANVLSSPCEPSPSGSSRAEPSHRSLCSCTITMPHSAEDLAHQQLGAEKCFGTSDEKSSSLSRCALRAQHLEHLVHRSYKTIDVFALTLCDTALWATTNL